ncbi:hypothetical protein BVRB_8g183350 [Beta vulgaris subsp. vulgaris]|nr:hypothetical protein BVRB_8g183350 [Beta vulgaris subsp. vulgaris]
MTKLSSWAYLGILFLISSQWLHLSSAKYQQNQQQPSTVPDADVSKPGWGPWTLPAPKPETKKGHGSGKEGGKGGGECNCNCNCDCQKTECKSNDSDRPGPVVCLPMTCDKINGCQFGGMNIEANNNMQIPHFTVAGLGLNGQSPLPKRMNTTGAGHHS